MRLLAVIAALYWVLSVPAVSDLLATRFHDRRPGLTTADVRNCDAIVVLGAGISTISSNGQTLNLPDPQTAFNAFEGARIYQLSAALPVVASGGVPDKRRQRPPESLVIRDLLVQAGVPFDRIVLDSDSRTTHEQAINVAALARQQGWQRIALIAPPVQMPRAVGTFAKQGLRSIVTVDAPFRSEPAHDEARSAWLPSFEALWVSQRALYDYFGWAYYWMRGWLA
jgi:uncharacterized SAM-binding protein YcdF (DUF218 family)